MKNFADYIIYELVDRFETPLKKTQVNYSTPDKINQWHWLWHHVYDGLEDIVFILLDARAGRIILTLIKILLVIPIQNAKVERMFSKMRRVATADRALLAEAHLEGILRMMEEGLLEVYNPIDAISIWAKEAT